MAREPDHATIEAQKLAHRWWERINDEIHIPPMPRDIRWLSLAPGDAIRVETRRGALVLKAREDRSIPEGMVFIPFCFAEAAANLLTNPQLDPFGKFPEFKFCAARVEPTPAAAAE